jgi:hypothetical protein
MVTAAFENKSGSEQFWVIYGFHPLSSGNGVVVASGFVSSGNTISETVNGYASYQFALTPGTTWHPTVPFQGDTKVTVVFDTTTS